MSDLAKRANEVGFHRAALERGATITDGPVPDDFEAGWSHAAFTGGKMIAHYYMREFDLGRGVTSYISKCRHVAFSSPRIPLFTPGNLPFCKRCENKLMKEMKTS